MHVDVDDERQVLFFYQGGSLFKTTVRGDEQVSTRRASSLALLSKRCLSERVDAGSSPRLAIEEAFASFACVPQQALSERTD